MSNVQCIYCAEPLSGKHWESTHLQHMLYKTITCPNCSKVHSIPMRSFHGSGHDAWDGTKDWNKSNSFSKPKATAKLIPLESKIKILSEDIKPIFGQNVW